MIRRASLALATLAWAAVLFAEPVDLDRDSLDDALEQSLLERFRPTFMLSATECDGRPAEFRSGESDPVKPVRNGTIYGQVFPAGDFIEIHFYHLWANDCGFGSHPLDVEHIAVLVAPPASGTLPGKYVAKYWFAAGHQGTPCDAAHGARAADLAAETSGVTVWVSHGKHASFLSKDTCGRLGCGGDRCPAMAAMAPGKLINIGEPGAPLNGAVWAASKKWGVQTKMTTEFTPGVIARLDSAEPREIVFIHPELIPAKAFILGGNHTLGAVGTGGKHTGLAIKTADKHTANALDTSARKTGSALKTATRSTAKFLGLRAKKPADAPSSTPPAESEEKTKIEPPSQD
ncbi:MAG TPA: hypothetical protein PLZ95_10400 [Bryobacteraceae bacterium]|nr:hypothetical protein [Bryobacteraceae bacterium]